MAPDRNLVLKYSTSYEISFWLPLSYSLAVSAVGGWQFKIHPKGRVKKVSLPEGLTPCIVVESYILEKPVASICRVDQGGPIFRVFKAFTSTLCTGSPYDPAGENCAVP
jgi:hypothetical protein